MIVFLTAAAGAALGGFQAKKRKGVTADVLQYAAVYAIIGALLGLFASILIARLG